MDLTKGAHSFSVVSSDVGGAFSWRHQSMASRSAASGLFLFLRKCCSYLACRPSKVRW